MYTALNKVNQSMSDTNSKIDNTKNMNTQKPSAFSGFLRYFYGNFVVLVLGLVSIPLITRVMSEEEYGRTGMFTSAVTVIYIFAILGMDQTYIRYYYKEGVDRTELLKRCLYPAVIIVSVLCGIYALFSRYANEFLFGAQGSILTLLVISYTVVSVFERFLFLDIRMSQNGKLYSNLNILSKVLYISLIIVFAVLLGDDFRVVMLAMTISLTIVTVGIGIRYIVKIRKRAAWKKTAYDSAAGMIIDAEGIENPAEQALVSRYDMTQGELIKYGVPFILVLLMEWLLSSCDKWALRIWSGYGELGIYNSAMNIMSILLTFKATFVAFWSPVAMEKYEQGNEDCQAFFRQAFNITRFFCVIAGVGLIMCKDLIVFILGRDYRAAANIIPFLTLMPVFSILFEITNQGIKFTKKNRYLNYASVVAITVNIVGNAILVPKFGGVGAALATGITYMGYFAIGSFFAEKCYYVGYENLKTVFYAVVLMGYALASTFYMSIWMSAVAGVILLVGVLLIDSKILLICVNYILGFFKRKA